MRETRGTYLISDERSLLQRDVVLALLQGTYWAGQRSAEQLGVAIDHSLCLGLYDGELQIGFARAVTDRAVATWICDVVIADSHRGQGLGRWLMQCLLAHPAVAGTTLYLSTRDARELYESLGFEPLDTCMRRQRRSS